MTHTNSEIIQRSNYNNNAETLLKVIAEMVALTPDNDASIVNVEIAPQSGWQGETEHKSGTAILIEETLTDGSKVYNLEIF